MFEAHLPPLLLPQILHHAVKLTPNLGIPVSDFGGVHVLVGGRFGEAGVRQGISVCKLRICFLRFR